MKRITDKVYILPRQDETDRPSLGLICGSKYSLVIDSGNSSKHVKDFTESIKSLGKDIAPLKYLAITHHHWDHVFGINEMNLITIGSESTSNELDYYKKIKWDDASLRKHVKAGLFTDFTFKCITSEMQSGERENFCVGSIDVVYDTKLKVDLGGLECTMELIECDHTKDSSIVYVPKEKVLFLGDCVYGGRYNGVYGYTKEKLYKMINSIEKYDADYYIVSHEEIFDRQGITKFFDQLMLVESIVGNSVDMDEILDRYRVTHNVPPTDDEKALIDCFVNVNRELGKST